MSFDKSKDLSRKLLESTGYLFKTTAQPGVTNSLSAHPPKASPLLPGRTTSLDSSWAEDPEIHQSIYIPIYPSIYMHTHTQGKDSWSFLCHGNNWNIGLHEKSCSSANSFSHPSYIFLPPRYNGSNQQFVIKWREN